MVKKILSNSGAPVGAADVADVAAAFAAPVDPAGRAAGRVSVPSTDLPVASTSASDAARPMDPAPLQIDHVVIAVSSLEVSLPYYAVLLEALGYQRSAHGQWRDATGISLQFIEAHEGSRAYERYGPGMNHLGFRARTPAQVEQVRHAMASAGFSAPEPQSLGKASALFMADPDGIRFEISHHP